MSVTPSMFAPLGHIASMKSLLIWWIKVSLLLNITMLQLLIMLNILCTLFLYVNIWWCSLPVYQFGSYDLNFYIQIVLSLHWSCCESLSFFIQNHSPGCKKIPEVGLPGSESCPHASWLWDTVQVTKLTSLRLTWWSQHQSSGTRVRPLVWAWC